MKVSVPLTSTRISFQGDIAAAPDGINTAAAADAAKSLLKRAGQHAAGHGHIVGGAAGRVEADQALHPHLVAVGLAVGDGHLVDDGVVAFELEASEIGQSGKE